MREVPMDVLQDALELARCVKRTHAHSRSGLDNVRATRQGPGLDVDSMSWVVWAIVIRWSSFPLISITKQEAPETTDLVGDPVYESAREEEMRRWLEELEEEDASGGTEVKTNGTPGEPVAIVQGVDGSVGVASVPVDEPELAAVT